MPYLITLGALNIRSSPTSKWWVTFLSSVDKEVKIFFEFHYFLLHWLTDVESTSISPKSFLNLPTFFCLVAKAASHVVSSHTSYLFLCLQCIKLFCQRTFWEILGILKRSDGYFLLSCTLTRIFSTILDLVKSYPRCLTLFAILRCLSE